MHTDVQKSRGTRRTVLIILGVLGLTSTRVPLAQAEAITCGSVLGPGGYFRLEEDLECPNLGASSLVLDGAVLDLNGHRIVCATGDIGCVFLRGHGAQLWNGTVQGGLHHSIVVDGDGGHVVWNVASTLVDTNVVVKSDYNRLINVQAASVYNPAFDIFGDHNHLLQSTAHCPFVALGACIAVSGDENQLLHNSVSVDDDCCGPGLGHGAIAITGNANQLWGNQVTNQDGVGLWVSGTGNVFVHNTVAGEPLDIQDLNGDCAHNTWWLNTVQTSDPACIGVPAGQERVAGR